MDVPNSVEERLSFYILTLMFFERNIVSSTSSDPDILDIVYSFRNMYESMHQLLIQCEEMHEDRPRTITDIIVYHDFMNNALTWYEIYNNTRRETIHVHVIENDKEPLYKMDQLTILPRLTETDEMLEKMVDCPICYTELPQGKCVNTGCSHSFCMTCIIKHWDTFGDHTQPTCALCRSTYHFVQIPDTSIFECVSSYIRQK